MEPINWREMSDKDKIRLIIERIMQWKYFESSADYSDALWRTGERVSVGYPVAVWSEHYGRCAVFHCDDVDAVPFDPLHSLDAAWQIVEKMKATNWGLFCIDLDGAITRHKWDLSADNPYVTWFETFLASLNTEAICIAALRTVGLEVMP